jgi:hypothetical protein
MDERQSPSPGTRYRKFTKPMMALAVIALMLGPILTAGCGGGSAADDASTTTTHPPASATSASGSTTASGEQPTARPDAGASPAGEWFFPDGTGSVVIEEGPLVAFVDLDGTILGGPYEATASGDSISLTLSQEDLVIIFGDDSGIESAELTFRPGSSGNELVMETSTEFGDQPSVTLTREPSGADSDT